MRRFDPRALHHSGCRQGPPSHLHPDQPIFCPAVSGLLGASAPWGSSETNVRL